MKKTQFYVCPVCGNVSATTGPMHIHCCGAALQPLTPMEVTETHNISIEPLDGELYVHMEHPMTKTHFIRFIAYVSGDKLLFTRLYPEQGIDLRFPQYKHGWFYICCSQHGLFKCRFTLPTPKKEKHTI